MIRLVIRSLGIVLFVQLIDSGTCSRCSFEVFVDAQILAHSKTHPHACFDEDIHTAASNLQLSLIKLLIYKTNEKMNKN